MELEFRNKRKIKPNSCVFGLLLTQLRSGSTVPLPELLYYYRSPFSRHFPSQLIPSAAASLKPFTAAVRFAPSSPLYCWLLLSSFCLRYVSHGDILIIYIYIYFVFFFIVGLNHFRLICSLNCCFFRSRR